MIRKTFASLALIAAAFGGQSAFGAQDWPFFVCSSEHAGLQSFVLGPTTHAETGFAMWTRDEGGVWHLSPASIHKQNYVYTISGCLSLTRERFNLEIPRDCRGNCDGFALVGDGRPERLKMSCTKIDAGGSE